MRLESFIFGFSAISGLDGDYLLSKQIAAVECDT